VPDNSELQPALRAKRYRELAAQARRVAVVARGEIKVSYFMLAQQWDALAAHLEADVKSGEQPLERRS
jgi:non-ribosomal peptide synthetase component E (peptide arylation enzyme)